MSLDSFEQSLLRELRQHVVDHAPAPRRVWTVRLAVAGVATGAAAAVAVAVGLGASILAPSAAYAIEDEPDGDVVVTVYDLTDASALEQALAAHGVRAEVTYDPGLAQVDGQSRATAGDGSAACDIALAKVDGGVRFTLGAAQIAGGARLDIVTAGSGPADVGSPVEVVWSGGAC